jgi:hypothetical protein
MMVPVRDRAVPRPVSSLEGAPPSRKRAVRLIWRLCLGLRGLAATSQPRKLSTDMYVMF